MPFRLPGSSRRGQRTWLESEVIWGVALREGHSDDGDPQAHAGALAHAFEIGNDERALCGFEPPKRAHATYRTPRAQLALPSAKHNPRCRKCAASVTAAFSNEEEAAEAEATESVEPSDDADSRTAVEGARIPARSQPVGLVGRPGATRSSPSPAAPPTSVSAPAEPLALVRRGHWQGTVTVPPGDRSIEVTAPDVPGSDLVARVVEGPEGIAVVEAVLASGRAELVLNGAASEPVTIAWFVVPELEGGVRGDDSR
ncbi:MAG: hypothetical protein M3N29_02755 [Chloroflexota bacterium]|nr:hypothetical protein [Chloroflexota bacterium]